MWVTVASTLLLSFLVARLLKRRTRPTMMTRREPPVTMRTVRVSMHSFLLEKRVEFANAVSCYGKPLHGLCGMRDKKYSSLGDTGDMKWLA